MKLSSLKINCNKKRLLKECVIKSDKGKVKLSKLKIKKRLLQNCIVKPPKKTRTLKCSSKLQ